MSTGTTFDRRVAALCGIAYVLLTYAAVTIGDAGLFGGRSEPLWENASAADALAYFATSRGPLLVKCVLNPLAVLALFVFIAGLRRALVAAGSGVLADSSALAGIMGGVFFAAIAAAEGAAAFRAPSIDASTARTLLDLSTAFFMISWFGFGGMTLAGGLAIVRTSAFPRWLGWLGIAAGVGYWIGPLLLPSELGLAAGFAAVVWVIAIGIRWLRAPV